MRLRLSLTDDATGATVAQAVVSQVFARRGEDELSDFAHAALPQFDVSAEAAGYRLKFRHEVVHVPTYVRVALKGYQLHCTVLRDQQAEHARGHCPRCGASMQEERIGGAYRSIAVARARCLVCGVEVVALAEAFSLGAPKGLGDGWVRVVSPMACSGCGEVLVPGTITANGRTVQVEACGGCRLVLLEPEDRAVLMGGVG